MKIAYCILTYNHSETMLEASVHFYSLFQEKDIDIYIYDSSTDSSTHSLYLAWKQKGLSNLYYVDCRGMNTGDEKYYKMIQGYGLEKEYDYIWPTKDRIYVSKSHLEKIISSLESNPDVLLLSRKNDTFIYEVPNMPESFTEPVAFFKYYGATSTSWNCVLFNYHTMLKDIDWNLYSQKYHINEINPFIQPAMLFTKLSELKKCNIKIVRPLPNERISISSSSGWVAKTVEIWGKKWPEAIRNLPSIYDSEKAFVIKSECMYPIVFGSIDHLIYLSDNNWFTPAMFAELKDDFTNLSDIPISYIELMFKKDYKTLFNNILNDFICAFNSKKYFKAMWLHNTAPQLQYLMGKETYDTLNDLFEQYQIEMMNFGKSTVFHGVTLSS